MIKSLSSIIKHKDNLIKDKFHNRGYKFLLKIVCFKSLNKIVIVNFVNILTFVNLKKPNLKVSTSLTFKGFLFKNSHKSFAILI
jgi:hypothetical protein